MPEEPQQQKFPTLPKDEQDAVALVQRQFREAIQEIDQRTSALNKEQRRRKIVAIVLKVVSVVSGLVIATGFLRQSVVQVLGGIIPCVAALERVFANLSRLLAVTAAKNAYDRVRRAVVARHNHEIVDVVGIRDRQPKTAADNLVNMDRKLNKLLADTKEDIETKLAKNDYDNLGRLTLDEDKDAVAVA